MGQMQSYELQFAKPSPTLWAFFKPFKLGSNLLHTKKGFVNKPFVEDLEVT